MDDKSVDRIMHSVQGGGDVNPLVIAVAIRAAVKECMDDKGKVNAGCLYELSCQLEKKKWDGIMGSIS